MFHVLHHQPLLAARLGPEFSRELQFACSRRRRPLTPCSGDEKEYTLKIQSPGVPKEHLKLELVGGNRLEVTENAGEDSDRRPLSHFALPPDADTKSIAACYRDGLLTVTIPKLDLDAARAAQAAQAEEADPELVEANYQVQEKRAKVEELAAILAVEKQQLREVEAKLMQAKRDAKIRLASTRHAVMIGTSLPVSETTAKSTEQADAESAPEFEEPELVSGVEADVV